MSAGTYYVLIVSCVLSLDSCLSDEPREVPEDLLLGAASSAYQIEGSWNISRSESIWDRALHDHPCFNEDCSNGDYSTNSYYDYEKPIEMIKELGLDFYRFSISWPRMLPYGFANYTNPEAIDYYNNLIDTLIENDIIPIVTIYHWDLPQTLQDIGGFENGNIVDWLGDFARICYENFGDRVKHWVTINEPKQICIWGYGEGTLAPLVTITGIADYMCAKNLLLAHANMYHIYDEEFRATQNGSVGFTMHSDWSEPESEADAEAADDVFQFEIGLFAHPIFSEEGNWPSSVVERVGNNSEEEGFPSSRLPVFSTDEIDYIKGSYDFFGLNFYTGFMVYRNESLVEKYPVPSNLNDIYAIKYIPDSWYGNASSWTVSVPWGFYNLLTKIREEYNNPTIYVTEAGYTIEKELNETDITDKDRVAYHRDHLNALLDAIEDGSDIRAYTVWSLMDSYEWIGGFRSPFGLYEVDRLSANMTMTPRQSAYAYKHIATTRTIDYDYTPDMSVPLADSP